MTELNRQWLLRARPEGRVKESDFELVSTPIPVPGEGQILVRNRWFSFEPAMRGWIEDRPNYLPPVPLGNVMRSSTVGEVVQSNVDGFEPGDLVTGLLGWQEYAIGDAGLRKLPPGTDPKMSLGVLGMTSFTAHVGLLDIGKLQPGETVVVSGAAGATGSVAAQIAKIKGCFVVGIAGGEKKCTWLTDKAGLDAAIDYKTENVGERLSELCPNGIDVFFDNVGGEILDEVLARIARNARIVICGSIQRYSDGEAPPGPRNYWNLTPQRGTMQGFVLLDHLSRAGEVTAELSEWVAEGKIAWETDVQQGFLNIPKTLLRLYTGANFGKQLLEA